MKITWICCSQWTNSSVRSLTTWGKTISGRRIPDNLEEKLNNFVEFKAWITIIKVSTIVEHLFFVMFQYEEPETPYDGENCLDQGTLDFIVAVQRPIDFYSLDLCLQTFLGRCTHMHPLIHHKTTSLAHLQLSPSLLHWAIFALPPAMVKNLRIIGRLFWQRNQFEASQPSL